IACVVWMEISQPWTFFSLPTRAWELGAGALVAFLMRTGARWLQRPGVGLLAWVGLAALIAVGVLYDESTPFPSYTAALPVIATALMIVGGGAPGGLHANRLLSLAPLPGDRRDLLFAVPGALAAAGDPAGRRRGRCHALPSGAAAAGGGGDPAGVAAVPLRRAPGDRLARAEEPSAAADRGGRTHRLDGSDRDRRRHPPGHLPGRDRQRADGIAGGADRGPGRHRLRAGPPHALARGRGVRQPRHLLQRLPPRPGEHRLQRLSDRRQPGGAPGVFVRRLPRRLLVSGAGEARRGREDPAGHQHQELVLLRGSAAAS